MCTQEMKRNPSHVEFYSDFLGRKDRDSTSSSPKLRALPKCQNDVTIEVALLKKGSLPATVYVAAASIH